MAGSVSNEKIEPMMATFGENVMQSENITCVADVSSSLNNKYFLVYNAAGTKFYVWYNVGAAGTDPLVSGGTAAPVAISANATATTVATATAAIVTALSGLDCTSDGAVCTVVNTSAGYAKPSHEGAAATGFTFEVNYYGDTAVDLGYTDGDIEVSHESNYVDLTAHQTGTQVVGHIGTGVSVGITLNLKESAVSQLRKVLATGEGDSLIADGTGVSATEVFGWGTSRMFKQTFARARKLVLHPIALPASNMSRDLTIWKAFPKVTGLTFSGENVMMIPVEFNVYPDYTKDSKINMVCYGDGSQTLT